MVADHGMECAVVATVEGHMVVGATVDTVPLEEGSTTLVDVSKVTPGGDTPEGGQSSLCRSKLWSSLD